MHGGFFLWGVKSLSALCAQSQQAPGSGGGAAHGAPASRLRGGPAGGLQADGHLGFRHKVPGLDVCMVPRDKLADPHGVYPPRTLTAARQVCPDLWRLGVAARIGARPSALIALLLEVTPVPWEHVSWC